MTRTGHKNTILLSSELPCRSTHEPAPAIVSKVDLQIKQFVRKFDVFIDGPPVVVTFDHPSPLLHMTIIWDVSVRSEPPAQIDHVHHRGKLSCPGLPLVTQLERASPIEATTASPAARSRTQSVDLAVTTLEDSRCFLRKVRRDVLLTPLINFEPEGSFSSPRVPPESCEGIRATRTFTCKWQIKETDVQQG